MEHALRRIYYASPKSKNIIACVSLLKNTTLKPLIYLDRTLYAIYSL